MLAQNFKTAAELDISEREFAAFRSLLGMLERQEIPYGEFEEGGAKEETLTHFNMNAIGCGKAGCFCGWARAIGGEDLFRLRRTPRQVEKLFLFVTACNGLGVGYTEFCRMRAAITPGQGAMALRNFLTCGDANWHEVLARGG